MEITSNFVEILTGFTVSILSALVYSIIPQGFLSGGLFRNKFQAIIILVVTALVLGFLTPTISNFWMSNIPKVDTIRDIAHIIGLILLVGTFTVNILVKNWKYTTKKSIVLYGLGIILVSIYDIMKKEKEDYYRECEMNCPECNAGLIKGEYRKERGGREYTEFRCPNYQGKFNIYAPITYL